MAPLHRRGEVRAERAQLCSPMGFSGVWWGAGEVLACWEGLGAGRQTLEEGDASGPPRVRMWVLGWVAWVYRAPRRVIPGEMMCHSFQARVCGSHCCAPDVTPGSTWGRGLASQPDRRPQDCRGRTGSEGGGCLRRLPRGGYRESVYCCDSPEFLRSPVTLCPGRPWKVSVMGWVCREARPPGPSPLHLKHRAGGHMGPHAQVYRGHVVRRGRWCQGLGGIGLCRAASLGPPWASGHPFQLPALGVADSALAGQISGHACWGERLGRPFLPQAWPRPSPHLKCSPGPLASSHPCSSRGWGQIPAGLPSAPSGVRGGHEGQFML